MKRYIRSSQDVQRLGDSLRTKRSVGLRDAIKYMEQSGSEFSVNYRNGRGYTSGYMTNTNDLGEGISVDPRAIDALENYLSEHHYTRTKEGYSEYQYIWSRQDVTAAKDFVVDSPDFANAYAVYAPHHPKTRTKYFSDYADAYDYAKKLAHRIAKAKGAVTKQYESVNIAKGLEILRAFRLDEI